MTKRKQNLPRHSEVFLIFTGQRPFLSALMSLAFTVSPKPCKGFPQHYASLTLEMTLYTEYITTMGARVLSEIVNDPNFGYQRIFH